MAIYPLELERRLDDRIWGGQRLASFLNIQSPPERIAESWQVFDTNLVLNGPLAGMTLAEVANRLGARLVGTFSILRYGTDFPLLAKFIDAQQDLSIQVHPDDDYAHAVEANTGFHGKNEAWYILEAEPDAGLTYHLARPVSPQAFAEALAAGELDRLLYRRPVTAGDILYVPAGTLHTIDAGITLFEIQQKSDLTYRVYDYDRLGKDGKPRALHLEKALQVIAFDRPPPPPVRPIPLNAEGNHILLLGCQSFAVERISVEAPMNASTHPTSLEIVTAIGGKGQLAWEGGVLPLPQGKSLVLPAALGAYQIAPVSEGVTCLRCSIPDLQDLRRLLKQLGHGEDQIDQVIF